MTAPHGIKVDIAAPQRRSPQAHSLGVEIDRTADPGSGHGISSFLATPSIDMALSVMDVEEPPDLRSQTLLQDLR